MMNSDTRSLVTRAARAISVASSCGRCSCRRGGGLSFMGLGSLEGVNRPLIPVRTRRSRSVSDHAVNKTPAIADRGLRLEGCAEPAEDRQEPEAKLEAECNPLVDDSLWAMFASIKQNMNADIDIVGPLL